MYSRANGSRAVSGQTWMRWKPAVKQWPASFRDCYIAAGNVSISVWLNWAKAGLNSAVICCEPSSVFYKPVITPTNERWDNDKFYQLDALTGNDFELMDTSSGEVQ